MARHYSKQDVDLHPHGGRMVPAVNVKLNYTLAEPGPNYGNSLATLLEAVRRDTGNEDQDGNDTSWVTAEWLQTHLIDAAETWRDHASYYYRDAVNAGRYDAGKAAEKLLVKLDEWACEQGWEDMQEDARQCFPEGSFYRYDSETGHYIPFHVEAEGRSSGWAVIPALPPLEEWDAIMLARWRRFEKYARQGADDIPYQMLWLYLMHEANDHMLRLTKARLGVEVPA